MTAALGRELSRHPMLRALDLAAQARGRTSPNPMVGAVVVRDAEVVGEGFHVYKDMRHAEIVALEQAGERARGATIYVTLEPCSHQGRTGPCVDAIVKAGVARVVCASGDPNPLVGGQGLEQLRAAGIAVDLAPEFSAQAERLNESFFHFMQRGRPLVTLKAALTLDGKIAAPEDNRGWITSELARAHVQQVRHESDAILTGIGTVLSDDCLLNDRSGLDRSRPLLRIVLDSQLRIPPNSRMVTSCGEDLLVVTTSAASAERRRTLENMGVRVLPLDGPMGRTNLHALVEELAKERYLSLMVEAGSKVNWSFLESGVVDKIFFYYAPKILGGMQSLPVAGGAGRRRRVDAIVLKDVTLHPIAPDEFAVEAYLIKEP
jgi:diaminohydroxyphosphoribosylaminopyrimidine deaminase/5-amino-6-(5-phosphoribosylamino)uracil reductase